MLRKTLFAALCLLLLMLPTGCWNRRELNQLAIAGAVGFDKAGDQVRLSIQIVNPGGISTKSGGGERSPVTVYSETADTVFEALRKLTNTVPRKIYLAHIRVLVIGESLAKKGIGPDLELFYRDQELRPDFYLAVAKGATAEEILSVFTSMEKIPAVNIFQALETSENVWAPTLAVNLDELIDGFQSEGKEAVLTGIQVKGKRKLGGSPENAKDIAPPATLQLTGLAAFRGDKLVGWLDEEESKGYNYAVNKVKSTVGYTPCPEGGKVVSEVIRSRAELKWTKSGEAGTIRVLIQPELNIAAVQCKLNLVDPNTIPYIKKKNDEKISEYIQKALFAVQQRIHADIFGFGETISRSDPKTWNRIKPNWNNTLSELPVKIEVDSKYRNVGTETESYMNQIEGNDG